MANIENAKLDLYNHQKEAYKKVEELFDKGRYAAVVFPTGCGKSFVTLKYILEHPDQQILFLSPRNAIKEQMYEYVVRFIGGVQDSVEEIQVQYGSMEKCAQTFIPGLKCMLYQTVLGIGENERLERWLEEHNYDTIVVDEMHHLKTRKQNEARDIVTDEEELLTEQEIAERKAQQNEWGRKFQELLSRYPNAKVLGLSATPVRTDGANVVERLFGNSVASEISLLEAMEEGIIIPPRYITPDFLEQDELETLLQQIEKAEGKKKEELKVKYDELVEQSSHAQGIPELLDEHIAERDGKYIIFCKDIKDMEEKQKLAREWFGKIDAEPEIYRVSSKHDDSQQQLDEFNVSDSEHIKLLYCVGMIDEGVHLKGVSGVILTAKTGSRPTYLQRIGRAISSGKDKKQALVIDLVNNNEILFDERQQSPEYGYEITDIESLQKLIDWIDEKNDGKLPEDIEGKSTRERAMARRLARINNKYFKYIDNSELITSITDIEERQEIEEIIALGESISLWNEYIEIEQPENTIVDDYINSFLTGVEIKGNRRDFREILSEASGKNDIPLYLKSAREIKKFYNKEGRLPRKTASIKDEEEKRLGTKLSDIRSSLITPYRKQKTEKDKRKFIENIRSLTKEQFIEILETIEGIDVEIAEKNIPPYLKNVRAIAQFYKDNGRLPRQHSTDKTEKKLAEKLAGIRSRLVNPYKKQESEEEKKAFIERRPETEKQFMEIISTIEEIEREIAEKNIPLYLQKVRKIAQFYKDNGRLPSTISKDENEKRLGKELSGIQTNLINPYKKQKTEENKREFIENLKSLTEEQFIEILTTIEEIKRDIKERNIPIMLQNVRAISEFYDREGRLPSRTSKDDNEKNLGIALSIIRNRLITPYKNEETEESKQAFIEKRPETEEQFMEILTTIERIDREMKEKNIPIMLQHMRAISEFYNREGKLPRATVTLKDENEKKLGKALIRIRSKLIKPYREQETEESKQAFIEKRPETEEQFMEIISMYEEIERDIAKKREILKLQQARARKGRASHRKKAALDLKRRTAEELARKKGKAHEE